ncbi:MAG: hypothetical protein ABI672_17890 [Vicinamibacteria bacterium]
MRIAPVDAVPGLLRGRRFDPVVGVEPVDHLIEELLRVSMAAWYSSR